MHPAAMEEQAGDRGKRFGDYDEVRAQVSDAKQHGWNRAKAEDVFAFLRAK